MPQGPAGPEFSQVRVLVSDFDASWKFYRDVVGLKPALGHGEGPYGEFLTGHGAAIALFDRAAMSEAIGRRVKSPPAKTLGGVTVVFEVADVDATAARLEAQGIALVQGPTNRAAWGLRTIHFLDPDGNLIEVFTRLPSP